MGEERDPKGVDGEWMGDDETAVDRGVGSGDAPATDVVFDLLSRRYRRFVLYCLYRRDRAIDVPQLAEAVVRLAESSPASSPTHDSVTMQLRHAILPRLADAGVVVYDREAGIVWPTDAVYAMEPLLEIAAGVDFESGQTLAEICTE